MLARALKESLQAIFTASFWQGFCVWGQRIGRRCRGGAGRVSFIERRGRGGYPRRRLWLRGGEERGVSVGERGVNLFFGAEIPTKSTLKPRTPRKSKEVKMGPNSCEGSLQADQEPSRQFLHCFFTISSQQEFYPCRFRVLHEEQIPKKISSLTSAESGSSH